MMKLKNVLSAEAVSTQLKGNTKVEIINELLDVLVSCKKVSDRATAFADLMERERKMSTGIQHGVAIPHAKTTSVSDLAACIGIKKEGMDFQALDGEPCRIFIMALSPMDQVGLHVQFLADISRVIKNGEARQQLLEATSAQEILEVFGL